MPIYIHPYNFIIDKEAVKAKYKGGIEQFRKDHITGKHDQEDQELFSISAMGIDGFAISRLTEKGLSYNAENPYSNDFTIYGRLQGFIWDVDWVEANGVYAWHSKCSEEHKHEAIKISNSNMEEIAERLDKGEDVFRTIF
jgi:hypothetical protein